MTTFLRTRSFRLFQLASLLLAVCCIVYGIRRGELPVVFKKAVRICMECIGLG